MESLQVSSQNSADVRAVQQHRTGVSRAVFAALGVMMLMLMVAMGTAAPTALTGAARVAAQSLRASVARNPVVMFASPSHVSTIPTGSHLPLSRPPLGVKPMAAQASHGAVPLKMKASGDDNEDDNGNLKRIFALYSAAFGLGVASDLYFNPPVNMIYRRQVKEAFEDVAAPKSANTDGVQNWRYTDFMNAVEADRVEKVTFSADGKRALVVDVDGNRFKLDALPKDPEMLNDLTKHKVDITVLPYIAPPKPKGR